MLSRSDYGNQCRMFYRLLCYLPARMPIMLKMDHPQGSVLSAAQTCLNVLYDYPRNIRLS